MAQVLTEFNVFRSDAFLDMSVDSQLGYIHLFGSTDSDGISTSSKSTLRMVGLHHEQVIQELYNNGFILIDEENSSIVVVHNLIHRKFRNDKSTYYKRSLSPTRNKLLVTSDKLLSFDEGTPYDEWRGCQTDEYSNKGISKSAGSDIPIVNTPSIESVFNNYLTTTASRDTASDLKCLNECIKLSKIGTIDAREQIKLSNLLSAGQSLHHAVEVLSRLQKSKKRKVSFDDYIRELDGVN